MFTKIIKYPEHKRPNISDREEVTAQEKDGNLCGSKVLEKVRDGWVQSTCREVGLRFKQGYFFHLTEGKAEYRILKPLISCLF